MKSSITDLSKLYNHKIARIIQLAISSLFFYRIFLNLVYSSEQEYQTPKDFFFCKAMVLLMIFVILFRQVPFKKFYVWLVMLVGFALMFVYYRMKGVNTDNYGPIYYKVILFNWIIVILFLGILVDYLSELFVFHKRIHYKSVILLAVSFLLFLAFDIKWYLPIVLPALALLMTKSNLVKKRIFSDGIAIGYYMSFLQVMTLSLLQNPNRFEGERYLGSFSQVESAGMFCCGALLCSIYLLMRCIWDDRLKKWYIILLAWTTSIYPAYSALIIASRSTLLAIFISIMVVIVSAISLKSRNNRKLPYVKSVIVLVSFFLICFCLLIGSSFLINHLYSKGTMKEVNYFWSHIMALTSKKAQVGYFKSILVLNNIDRVCSGRLAIFVECTKTIGIKGRHFEGVYVDYGNPDLNEFSRSTHNFFILWFINGGIVGGLAMLIWYFCYVVRTLKEFFSKRVTSILPMLFICASFSFFMFSCINWKYPMAIMILILQYLVFDDSLLNLSYFGERKKNNEIREQ